MHMLGYVLRRNLPSRSRIEELRTMRRPRRYIAGHWITVFRPILRYSRSRDAYILRAVGGSRGPVLRIDRRVRRKHGFDGVDRRGRASIA